MTSLGNTRFKMTSDRSNLSLLTGGVKPEKDVNAQARAIL